MIAELVPAQRGLIVATLGTTMTVAHLKDNPDEIDKLLGEGFIRPSQRRATTELFHQMVEMMPDEGILDSMEQGFGQIAEIAERFPNLAKAGQNKALILDVASHSRVQFHLNSKYSVFRPESGSLILPDTTLAFVTKEGAS